MAFPFLYPGQVQGHGRYTSFASFFLGIPMSAAFKEKKSPSNKPSIIVVVLRTRRKNNKPSECLTNPMNGCD